MEIRKSCRPGEHDVRAVTCDGQRRNRRRGGVCVNVRRPSAFSCAAGVEYGLDFVCVEWAIVKGNFVNNAHKTVQQKIASRSEGWRRRELKSRVIRRHGKSTAVNVEDNFRTGFCDRHMMKRRIGDGFKKNNVINRNLGEKQAAVIFNSKAVANL